MKLLFGGTSKDGKLDLYQRASFQNQFASAFRDGDEVLITVEKKKYPKSDRQRGYYFGAIIPGCQAGYREAGYRLTLQQCRAILEGQSPVMEIEIPTGEEMTYGRVGLSDLSKAQMVEHIDWCLQWIMESLGYYVLTPDEYYDQLMVRKAPVLG